MHIKFLKQQDEDEREMYYRNLSRNLAQSNQSEMERQPRRFENAACDAPRRKASINELSEDEIVFAYNNRRADKTPTAVEARAKKSEDLSSAMKEEFLRWMEMKRRDEKLNPTVTSNIAKSVRVEKVNETERLKDVVNVVKDEHEEASTDDVIEHNEAPSDFDEFKDVVSDDEEDEYLKVPLVIREDGDDRKELQVDDIKTFQDVGKYEEDSSTPTVVESNIQKEKSLNYATDSEQITIDAKITLTNAPLEVVTSLSSSSLSLAPSDKSTDDASNKKRPVNHSKGRAPPPPPPSAVIPGHFYDHVTKKHFKETEL